MYNHFPRELGFPKRFVVWNIKDFIKYINVYNGKTACYTSLYHYEIITGENGKQKPVPESAIIDKIFFDFDNVETCYNDTKKLHEWCDKQELKHCIDFSGRGFHVIIFCEQSKLLNKKDTIKNSQQFICKKLDLNLDEQTTGNISQMIRVPNTFNIKRRRYCIPLNRGQFEKNNYEQIRELAEKQNKIKKVIMGKKLWNINEFDTEVKISKLKIDISDLKINDIEIKKIYDNMPECIKRISNFIKGNKNSYNERFYLILYMKESDYSLKNTIMFLKELLPLNKLKHCINTEMQPQYIYKRDELLFPSCNTFEKLGYCEKKCKSYNKLFYK